MNIILWIVFGALAGWIASIIMSTNDEQGGFLNIVIGIAGAIVGGFIARLFGVGDVNGFDPLSLLIAIIGAILVIAIIKTFRRSSVRR